jgi:hypothetical protein
MKVPYEIDDYGNIIATKGVAPWSCFCAHLDTVHMYPNGYNIYIVNREGRLYIDGEDDEKKAVGVGGDDKCGIFVCLFLLENAENVRTIFFTKEESGGLGSKSIDIGWLEDCKFLGGVDRWNGHDFINKYAGDHTISKDFKEVIVPLMKLRGYSFNTGLFTDSFNVQQRKIGISTFNLSCGYYAHHSTSEYVDLAELYNSCLLCYELSTLPTAFPYDLPVKKYNTYDYKYGYGYGWGYDEYGYNRDGHTLGSYKGPKDSAAADDRQEAGACWERDSKTGVWHKAYNEIKQSVWPSKRTKDRLCANCQLELIQGEKKYCATCRPYFFDDVTPESYIDD